MSTHIKPDPYTRVSDRLLCCLCDSLMFVTALGLGVFVGIYSLNRVPAKTQARVACCAIGPGPDGYCLRAGENVQMMPLPDARP